MASTTNMLGLPSVTSLSGDETFWVVQGGTDKRVTLQNVVNFTVTAANIQNVPAGNVSATNVQGAINELDTEKAAIASLANIAFSGSANDLVAGTVLSSRGGTGVSNSSLSTITISGAFPIKITATANSCVTYPTSGTLAALDNTQTWTSVQTFSSAILNVPTLSSGTGLGLGKVVGWQGGFAANRYYTGSFITGAPTAGGAVLSSNKIYFSPFIVGESHTWNQMLIFVNATGTAASARLGIYNVSNGLPTSLVVDASSVVVNTTGQKTLTINQLLAAGSYVLGVLLDGTANLDGITPNSAVFAGAFGFGGSSGFASIDGSISATQTYGALPSNISSANIVYSSAIQVPVIMLRA